MKRLVKLEQGWVELDIRTYRQLPRLLRRLGPAGGYSVLLTRFAPDGWAVGDPEYPTKSWRAGQDTSSLAAVLAEFAETTPEEAEVIVAETMTEWERRDPGAAV